MLNVTQYSCLQDLFSVPLLDILDLWEKWIIIVVFFFSSYIYIFLKDWQPGL